MTDTKQTNAPAAKKKNIIFVFLSGAMALTIIVMMFLPDSGMGTGLMAIYGSMIWCGIFGASLARYLGKSGWFGFGFGSAAGMLIQFISQFV
jgi:hypothetical protein